MALREYLRLLRGRAWWIVGGLLLGLSCSGILIFLSTPIYAASVTFYVKASDAGGGLDQAYSSSLFAKKEAKSYLELITSERVRVDVNRRLGPVAPGQISAESEPDSVVLTATATDASPKRAQDIANAVGIVFSDLVFELERFPDAPRAPLNVDVIYPAALPGSPVAPIPKTNLAFGSILGLLAGWAVALLPMPLRSTGGRHRK
ncbi:MAG: YveK family protein [Pseudonocardiaceae bacterium]